MKDKRRRWMEFATQLVNDTHPGARFLRTHLNAVRRLVSDSPTGELLLVPAEEDTQWQGAAGVTVECGCVKVHFMYIQPSFRNTEVIADLFKKIIEIGRHNYYGYVIVQCPLIDGLESQHDFFSRLAEATVDETVASDAVVRCYRIKKDAFEAVV